MSTTKRDGVVDMNVRYEALQDVLIMKLRSGVPIAEIREDEGGSVYCYDDTGRLVALEIVDASRNLEKIRWLERRLNEFVDGHQSRGA